MARQPVQWPAATTSRSKPRIASTVCGMIRSFVPERCRPPTTQCSCTPGKLSRAWLSTLITPAWVQAVNTTSPLPRTFTATKRSSTRSSSELPAFAVLVRRCWPGRPLSNGVRRGISPLT